LEQAKRVGISSTIPNQFGHLRYDPEDDGVFGYLIIS